MIRVRVRIALAAAGVALLAAAAFSVRAAGARPAGWLMALLGAAFIVPAVVETALGDLDRVEEQLRRFRTAGLLCFTVAVGIYLCVMSLADPRGELATDLAALGTAFWLVAMLMLAAVLLLASRRRTLTSR